MSERQQLTVLTPPHHLALTFFPLPLLQCFLSLGGDGGGAGGGGGGVSSGGGGDGDGGS